MTVLWYTWVLVYEECQYEHHLELLVNIWARFSMTFCMHNFMLLSSSTLRPLVGPGGLYMAFCVCVLYLSSLSFYLPFCSVICLFYLCLASFSLFAFLLSLSSLLLQPIDILN